MQLPKLHGQADPTILSWIEKKSDKYTSPPVQNENIQFIALRILRKVANSVLADAFFTIMADETTNVSNREQVVLVLRHVDSELNVQEDFIGLYVAPSIDAQTITNVIKGATHETATEPVICQAQSVGSPQTSPQKNQGPSIHTAMDMLSTWLLVIQYG